MDVLQITPELEVTHMGPPLEKGHLPAVFYFALSARESLELEPYNQPATYLLNHEVRLFSFNLPAHGPNLNAIDALTVWAKEYGEGRDPLSHFFDQVVLSIDALISKGLVVREKIGLMGLSRGGLAAMHVAARCSLVRAVVAFAPMIELGFAKEFADLQGNPTVDALDLTRQTAKLYDRPVKIYIGNRDTRVDMGRSFQLVEGLANEAFANGLRSPPAEMVVSPSIGHMGHGTSKEVFENGADWLGRKLGVIR